MMKLITGGQAARILGVSAKHVSNLSASGQLPVAAAAKNGSWEVRLYRPEDVAALAEKRQRTAGREWSPSHE